MRKNMITIILLAALLAAAVGSALAAGTQADPFVTLSWLTGAYFDQASADMLTQAQAATAATEQAALDRLNALAGVHLEQAAAQTGQTYSDAFLRLSLVRGDRLELTTGDSLLFESGIVSLSFAGGMLVDVTDGGTVSEGGALTAGHRYVAAEDTACSLFVLSDAAYLSIQGGYDLEKGSGGPYTPFTDIQESDWYYTPVAYAYENGLFNGVSTTAFSPGTNMNRAMLATVLSRMDGAKTDIPSAGFTDVPDDVWFADAVNWAASVGVVTGIGDGSFAPNAALTREQVAVMLFRYAKNYLGMEVAGSGDLSAFTDAGSVSSWAVEAVSWAVDNGIVTGYDGVLSPGGTAARAQVAAMLQRFNGLM